MLPTKYQFILPSGFRGNYFFINQPGRNKTCLWRPDLLTERDELSNRYKEPTINVSFLVSLQLAKWLQRKRSFSNRPIRKKNCLWRPDLLMDWDNKSNRYRGSSVDASYQASVHLAKRFQRIIFFRKWKRVNAIFKQAILRNVRWQHDSQYNCLNKIIM